MNDPRVEAAIPSVREDLSRPIWLAPRRIATRVIEAADQDDRERGIYRVKVDDETVDRVAAVMYGFVFSFPYTPEGQFAERFRKEARAVLEALKDATDDPR